MVTMVIAKEIMDKEKETKTSILKKYPAYSLCKM